MRKIDGSVPYYNIAKDYIRWSIDVYLGVSISEKEEKEPILVSSIDEPHEIEYGGFWFRKGYNDQKDRLIHFYQKFGFYDEPKVHLDWHCYGEIPYPSMICNL